MSVLDGRAGSGRTDSTAPRVAERTSPYRPGACPECSEAFAKVHPGQMFCSAEHKRDFHNRQTVRGRTLVPLAMADRMTRGGSRGDTATGRAARRDVQMLIARWMREDAAAGRMSMVDYMRERRRMGYDVQM